VMRCNALNLGYRDAFGPEHNFSSVNEIFQSTEGLLYLRSKIEVSEELRLTLMMEGKELVQMTLRNTEASRSGPLASEGTEMLRVDQLLDGRMRVQVVMGIPTLLHPTSSGLEGQNSP
jgi:hypothetical protein